MKVSEIIKNTAVFLGKENVIALTEGEFVEDKAQAEKDKTLLLKCLNLVIDQLSSEYVPFFKEESFVTDDGVIPFSDFSNKVIEVKGVYDQKGGKADFKNFSTHIKTVAGEVKVEYCYVPANLTENSEIFLSNGRLTERIIAYGVASEYALSEQRYEEASMWDERFKQSLMTVLHPKNVRVRKRRWL